LTGVNSVPPPFIGTRNSLGEGTPVPVMRKIQIVAQMELAKECVSFPRKTRTANDISNKNKCCREPQLYV